jgi:ABC-type transporter Mla subunit MlaD
LGLQDLPEKGDLVIAGASALFSAENAAMANRILANLDKLRIQFAADAPVFDSLSPAIGDAVARFKQAWAEIQQSGEYIDRLKAVLAAASQAIQSMSGTFGKTATNLGGFVDDNRRPFMDFASNGYPQVAPMISDLHRLGRTLNRLWTEIKEDPARFFLTDRQEGGFQAPPPSIGPHR